MRLLKFFGIVFMFVLTVISVAAVPTGPTNIDIINSSRYTIMGASNTTAIAGNVTELNFQSNTITSTWQGYYGEISGSIRLGNSNNDTLYDWTDASPSGEIYATRIATTPVWTSIKCANVTNIDAEDTALGVTQLTDQDSVNRTFLNTTSFGDFYVGSININTTQDCFAVNLHNGSGAVSTEFAEVVLHDGTDLVYTSVITRNSIGFDNRTHDFEMIVGEDGHNGDTNPTTYYFYVELG